jgi:uncharacterized protein DUF2383
MTVDQVLRDLLQLCADTQDGFWEAAAHATSEDLPLLFQSFAVQWNDFSDRLFSILLAVDHTSPEMRWKADPNRIWMSPSQESGSIDDLAICMQCMHGLELAQSKLQEASATGGPMIREIVARQLGTMAEQMAAISDHASTKDHGVV